MIVMTCWEMMLLCGRMRAQSVFLEYTWPIGMDFGFLFGGAGCYAFSLPSQFFSLDPSIFKSCKCQNVPNKWGTWEPIVLGTHAPLVVH